MSASASLADKATKLFSTLCAGATVVGVSTLVVNVYYNTGKHRKPLPLSAGDIEDNVAEPAADTMGTESKGS